mmetsp:Transcript_13152/g.30505  ORF Transcript_13152/g.30505 Transcript_13152/m.30505 type:complete len:185 (-) Transcript_13152:49-603(-)
MSFAGDPADVKEEARSKMRLDSNIKGFSGAPMGLSRSTDPHINAARDTLLRVASQDLEGRDSQLLDSFEAGLASSREGVDREQVMVIRQVMALERRRSVTAVTLRIQDSTDTTRVESALSSERTASIATVEPAPPEKKGGKYPPIQSPEGLKFLENLQRLPTVGVDGRRRIIDDSGSLALSTAW